MLCQSSPRVATCRRQPRSATANRQHSPPPAIYIYYEVFCSCRPCSSNFVVQFICEKTWVEEREENCEIDSIHLCVSVITSYSPIILYTLQGRPKAKKDDGPILDPYPDHNLVPMRNVTENEVIELDRTMGRKAEKGKRKAQGKQAEEIIELRKMKYTL
ncbi:hypothetical protein L1987_03668 [Smallanthus sonchifolius]|uniref:Uncharacterized protein n=1 Tax=Smallanthus sonchifolius TaxID=185202 RepID=A0ACB9KBB0_9ASTR|nr:hypothetical protein L1987_03668 [Smallanthus sonchifolius]